MSCNCVGVGPNGLMGNPPAHLAGCPAGKSWAEKHYDLVRQPTPRSAIPHEPIFFRADVGSGGLVDICEFCGVERDRHHAAQ